MNDLESGKNIDSSVSDYMLNDEKTIRTFIAYNFNSDAIENIKTNQNKLKNELCDYFKWESYDKFHITLKFIGETDKEFLNRTKKALVESSSKFRTFKINICAFAGVFPDMDNPAVLWLGINDETGMLKKLAGFYDDSLNEYRIKPDGKIFNPHITIARTKNKKKRRQYYKIDFINTFIPVPMEIVIDKISIIHSDHGNYKKIFTVDL